MADAAVEISTSVQLGVLQPPISIDLLLPEELNAPVIVSAPAPGGATQAVVTEDIRHAGTFVAFFGKMVVERCRRPRRTSLEGHCQLVTCS